LTIDFLINPSSGGGLIIGDCDLIRLLRQQRARDFLAADIIFAAVAATFIIPGGADIHLVYLRLAQGCLDCVYNPWHAHWLFYPIQFIPELLLYPVWVLLSGIGIFWAAKRLKTEPLFVLATFPFIAQVWLGQVDVLIIVGLVLALLSPNAFIRGFGLLLTSFKPQVVGPAVLLLLLRDEEPLKTLVIPAVVFVISLVVWGIGWPVEWLTYIMTTPHPHPWAAGVLFPVGLLAFPAVFLFKDKREQLTVILLATTLGIPRVASYSHLIFLVLLAPWWVMPVSFAWLLGLPIIGIDAIQFTWILPFTVLLTMLWPRIRAYRSDNLPKLFSKDTVVEEDSG
jgi:hypothetical protein